MNYLRKTDTGECFPHTEHLSARKDMVRWQGPLPWEKKEEEKQNAADATIKDANAPKTAIDIDLPKEHATSEPANPDDAKKEDAAVEFKCEVCDKVCASKLGLAAHMRSHK